MAAKIIGEQWKAISENDKSYDNKFFYAVKTTKVFCRPSCKSRVPNFDNVTIFYSAEGAMKAGYRPCKRCKSGGYRLPDEEWVLQAEAYMKENYSSYMTLDFIADGCHGSPYHLHRVFKSIKGITPLEYLQRIRMEKAMDYLKHSDTAVSEIGNLIGIPNAAHFATLFKKRNSLTPREFRKNYKKEVLQNEV
ncbi:AraC family transcriptional regulator [Virgibacillus profundi]|uniref:AraC family transcriptional regulator n=1 Tax=Virgibacillus profundi TaxID=2024555 RepID=A0A2A2IJA5_9BACI|nr:bifunctional transcriptional activator/DNA repair enzyme AdaA [Virgibacillus profundi]PAV31612.1 AraC family transcriptional regulator [Virgibacillus profundi]PXY55798.1 AraC family transcriptional regulator [Virgibacillus profundi]